MYELRSLHGGMPRGGILQLRPASDSEHRADARRRCDRGLDEERHHLVLRRVHVVPPALSVRNLSQKLGFFVESEKGRQQLALKRSIGDNILRTGYCIVPKLVKAELHPEQGTVWRWILDHDEEVYGRFTENYNREGAGALRKVSDETLDEIHRIFDLTGGTEMFETIERHSDRKAREMGYDGADERYFTDTYTLNSNEHY